MRSTVFCTLCQKQTRECSSNEYARIPSGRSLAIQGDVLMRLVISIQRGSYPRYSASLSAFFFPSVSLVKWNCSARYSLSLFSLARSQSCESTIILFFPLLPLCHRATWIRASRWRRSAARPTLTLFSSGFSPPPTLVDPLSSPPAISSSSAAAIPAPVASLTNRAAREYIFYRHS